MLHVLLWWNTEGSRGCSTTACSTELMQAALWQLSSKQPRETSETWLCAAYWNLRSSSKPHFAYIRECRTVANCSVNLMASDRPYRYFTTVFRDRGCLRGCQVLRVSLHCNAHRAAHSTQPRELHSPG